MDQELLQHLGAESIKATPQPDLQPQLGSKFNQQLLLATVQMLPVEIWFSSGPTSHFNGLLKAWEPGVEPG